MKKNDTFGKKHHQAVGVVKIRENGKRLRTEADFVRKQGTNRIYNTVSINP